MKIPKNLAVSIIVASMIIGILTPAVQAAPSFVSIASLNPETGVVGTIVDIAGTTDEASITIQICYRKTDIARPTAPCSPADVLGTATSGANGRWSTTVTIPESVAGRHPVLAVLRDFNSIQATREFTVVPRMLLDSDSGSVGSQKIFRGMGFAGNSPTTIDYDNSPMSCLPITGSPPVRTNAVGSFSARCTIPESDFTVPDGRHEVEGVDSARNTDPDQNLFFLIPSVSISPTQGPVGVGVNTDRGTTLTPPPPDPAVRLAVMARGFVRLSDITVCFERGSLRFENCRTGRTNALGTFQFEFPMPEIPQKPAGVYTFDANQTVGGLTLGPPSMAPDVVVVVAEFQPVTDIDLNPDHARFMEEVEATGTAFAAASPVEVSLRRAPSLGSRPCSGPIVQSLLSGRTLPTGSFFLNFSTPSSAAVTPGLYQVSARDGDGNEACADFVIGIFLRVRPGTPNEGRVSDTVTLEGFAFKGGQVNLRMVKLPSDTSDRGCDSIPTRFTPNANGDFSGQFVVPNCNKGDYLITGEDERGGRASAEYQVFPWIIVDPMTGVVGSTVTVDGTGWGRNVDVAVIYFGADATMDKLGTKSPQGFTPANSRTIWYGSIPQSGIMGTLSANDLAGFWRIETIGGEKSFITRSGMFGQFRMTFTVPESWGGYHPVYGREVQSMVECGPNGGGPVVSEQTLCGQAFRLKPTVEVNPPEAKAGQRNLMLEGSGLSWWDHYAQKTTAAGSFAETNKVYRLRLDFVQADGTRFQGYIDEARHIYNGLRDSSWDMGAYAPVALNEQGTIVYWDYRLEDRTGSTPPGGSLGQIGSPFLQAPSLQPGSYNLRAYRQTLSSPPQPDLSESTDASLTIRSAELDDMRTGFGQMRTHVNAEVNRIRDELTTFVNNNLKPFLTVEVNRVRDEVRTQVTSETNRIRDEVKSFTTQEANRVRDAVNTQVTSETNRVRDELRTFTTQEANRVRDEVRTQVTSETNRVRDELKSFTTQEANRIRDAMTPAVNEARQNTADLKAAIPLTLQTSPLGFVIAILAAIAALGSIAAAIITSRRLKVAG